MRKRGQPPSGAPRVWQPDCLKCRTGFWAISRHNRICSTCAKANARLPRLAQHAVASCPPVAEDEDEDA